MAEGEAARKSPVPAANGERRQTNAGAIRLCAAHSRPDTYETNLPLGRNPPVTCAAHSAHRAPAFLTTLAGKLGQTRL